MKFDWILAVVMAALALFGIILQTRLSGTVPPLGATVVGLVAGLATYFICAQGRLARWLGTDPRKTGSGPVKVGTGPKRMGTGPGKMGTNPGRMGTGPGLLTWAAWGLSLGMMGALLVFGHRYRGGLYLPGRINPSEIVKPLMVIFCAGFLGWGSVPMRKEGSRGSVPRWMEGIGGWMIFAIMVGCVCLSGVLAGDMGFVAQIVLTCMAVVWVKSIGWGLVASALVGGVLYLMVAHPVGHAVTRFAVWRDPFADVTGQGWQTLQGIAALMNGGWMGSGFGCGEVERVPIVASDFVYAAVGEDLGWVGCAVLLTLWWYVFMRGLWIAHRREQEGRRVEGLIALGVVASLSVQVFLNVAGVLNVLPMTGITLPFISLGGSSFVATAILCALLLSVSGSCRSVPTGKI